MKARPPHKVATPLPPALTGPGSSIALDSTAELPTVARAPTVSVTDTEACLLAALMDNIPDNIYFKDLNSRFIRINRAMAAYLGLADCAEAIGRTDADFFDRHHAEQALRDEQEVIRTGQPIVGKDERETYAGGGVRWVSSTKLPLRDQSGRIVGTFGISRDITARKSAEDQLYEQAFYDPLTHLPNRALLLERLRQLMKAGRRHGQAQFAVLFLDIDRFKSINESLGHAVGDCLIKAMARRLETCLRPGDLVARISGDEFAILLDDVGDAPDVTRVAERIHDAMQTPFEVAGTELYCTVSIGIAQADAFHEHGEDLLRDADTAMYQAKSSGRARHVVFLSGMHDRARDLLRLETDLRRAIDRREFRLYYQPIVDAAAGRLAGFESLLRWEHPERKLVFPDAFIPLSEETGLICNIGTWSLEQACLQLTRWRAQPPSAGGLRINVNLSPRQFQQADLLRHIERVLSETGAEPSGINLEITESALMRDVDHAAEILRELRGLGMGVCIDDFGMGYSSLGQLEMLAIDGLKIDRAFVARMLASPKAREIVRTIVALGNNLGVTVTAEGVELREQLDLLLAMGCSRFQGFLFSRAVPVDEAERLVAGALPAGWLQ